MSSASSQVNIKHKAKRTGSSADRKKLRDQAKKSITSVTNQGKKQQNLKAFTFSSIYAAQRDQIRIASQEHKRHHAHIERKDLVELPPPRVVCVAGPPGSGKSTLIKCLVKHFTRTPAFNCVGPVTVRVNNTLRLTFIEVNTDIGAMIDTAKIADVVILVVDGSYGFELETFEYLNMLKTHGFPKVMGVLTHMDHLTPGSFSRTKKLMKKRFQQDVSDGAKVMHVSGLIHGRYPRREILNIGRYLSTAKGKPQTFRNEHPYLVIDRVEDMTHPGLIHNNPTMDRTVALYGYVRGCPLRQGQNVHLLGVGDFQCKDVSILDDPVPLMSHYKGDTTEDREKRRTLKKENIVVHAPFSDVGTVINDKDAIYIKQRSEKIRWSNKEDLIMLGSNAKNTKEDIEQQRIDVFRRLDRLDDHQRFVQTLMDKNGISTTPKLDELLQNQTISLFDNHESITSKQFEELHKYRDGSSALPNEALRNQDSDNDDVDDDNAEGQHDVNDMDELLSSLGGGNNNTNNKDDIYNRMTIKEVIGADGRVRKQVVFANQININNNDIDSDDDMNDNYERGNFDDDDDGYYSLDEEDLNEETDLSEKSKNYIKKRQALSTMNDGDDDYNEDDYDEDDYDDEDDELNDAMGQFNFGEGEDDDNNDELSNYGTYDSEDYPDYEDNDEDDDEDNYQSDEDDHHNSISLFDSTTTKSLQSKSKPSKPTSNEQVYLGSTQHSVIQPSYNITNYVRGGLSGVYQSLQDPTQTTEQNNVFFKRSQHSFQNSNLSLIDLVYGKKESLFDQLGTNNQQNNNNGSSNTNNLSFGGVFDSNNQDDMNSMIPQDNDDNDDDDFFVARHNVKQKMLQNNQSFNSNDDDIGFIRTAGQTIATQTTFAKSHIDFASKKGDQIDSKSAVNNIQRVSKHQSMNMFDNNLDIDSTFNITKESLLSDWKDDMMRDTLRNRFVTGNWDEAKSKFDGKDNTDENFDGDMIDLEDGTQKYPDEYNTDDESLDYNEKAQRRKLRREWQRQTLFNINQKQKDNDEQWGENAFGQNVGKKKSGQKGGKGIDDKIFDHQEQLFGDFEEVNDNDDNNDDIDTEADQIRKHLEAKIKQKDSFLAELEREAAQDALDEENGKNNKDNRGVKKKALNKQIMANHFDYFQAQHDIIMERIEKSKEEMAKLSVEDRLILFGAQPGQYVRIILTAIPCEFIEHLDPTFPIVLGGLLPTEQNMGYLNMRVKKHRWFHRLLKSQDPLIWSSGWRRFQSIPIFYVEDIKQNNRFLKYTPEHLHCLSTMYGPLVAPNSGIIAFKNVYMATKSVNMENKTTSSFRVALTGVVLDNNKQVEIRKKLKLIGTPFQIFNKTAYIQGMFNSALEVSRFEGAKIQTVSGIPGRIVKALTHEGKEGTYRATFNDKVVKSDIIMCKTFVTVKIYKYYNPVTSLLLANKSGWKGMRTHKEIRADKGAVIQSTQDNEYKDIIREKRKFNKLHISAALQAALPFKSKEKLNKAQEKAHNITVLQKKLNKKLRNEDQVNKIISKKKNKATYEDKRHRFDEKKDRTIRNFIDTLDTLEKDHIETQKIARAAKRKKVHGDTTEKRERIEHLKAKAKKQKHSQATKLQVKANKASAKGFKGKKKGGGGDDE